MVTILLCADSLGSSDPVDVSLLTRRSWHRVFRVFSTRQAQTGGRVERVVGTDSDV